MSFFKKKETPFRYFLRNLYTVIAIVLIWRGIWYVLDELDKYLFGQSHVWTAFVGIVLGLILLYIPDKDLKEINKL
jgi:hypothetical protein